MSLQLDNKFFIERDCGFRIKLKPMDDSVWNKLKPNVFKFKNFRFFLAEKYIELLKLSHTDKNSLDFLFNEIDLNHRKYFIVDFFDTFSPGVNKDVFIA